MSVLLPSHRPAIMAILNVTPDSFSDGGLHFSHDSAIEAGLRMIQDGADILDVGGESTRPGAVPVTLEDELARVIPVVHGLARAGAVVSVDTMKAGVARAALEAGAKIVNDVSSFSDPDMAATCADGKATVCLMHMQGSPQTMQQNPHYANVVAEVEAYLLDKAASAAKAGIPSHHLWIDPGIGFGKTDEHNLALIRNLEVFAATGYPVLLGVSRKGFIGRVLGSAREPLPVAERSEGTLAIQIYAQLKGVKVLRTHEPLAARRTADMISTLSSD